MLKAKWPVGYLLACALIQAAPFAAPLSVLAADTVPVNQRPAVILQKQGTSLNNMLMQAMRQDLPMLNYRMLGQTSGDPKQLLQSLKDYLRLHPNEAASHADAELLQLGAQSLSWGDIKAIIASAVVMVPDWSYGPLELTGPHAVGDAGSETWELRAESNLDLSLDIFDLRPLVPALATTQHQTFRVVKSIPIRDLGQLLSLVKDVTKVDVDIHNSLHQIMILDVLRKLPTFQELLAQNPAEYLSSESLQAVAGTGFAPLVAALRQQSVIQPKGGILEADMQKGIRIGLSESDTVKPHVDLGYRILDDSGEVGYGRVRQVDADGATLEPIMVKRDFQIGDRIEPVPKLGLNVVLRGGTSPLWLADQNTQIYGPQIANFFSPNAELDFQYDIGQFFGFPEFYATLGGGGTFVLAAYPGLPSATGISGELGLLKRWYLRQWVIEAGLSGGMLFGLLSIAGRYDTPTSLGFGGTARLGISYQFTPEFLIGLHTGFRYFGGGLWMTSLTPGYPAQPDYSLPALGGWGPLIQLNASYTF